MHFFIHIPKTAGTSFRIAAEEYLGAERVIYDYGEHSPVTSACVREYLYGRDEPDLAGLVQHWQVSQPALIAGHKGLKRFAPVVRLDHVLTFLREPLARCFSEYAHLVKHGCHEGSFRSFFSNEKRINRQLRMLSGVPFQALGMVGITEHYGDGLSLINDHCAWAVSVKRLNKAGWLARKLSRVSAADRAEFATLHAADLALYDAACRVLNQRLSLQRSGQPFVHGGWAMDESGHITGWAWRAGERSDESVSLELWHDGELIETQQSGQRSSQFSGYEVPRAGEVGFAFNQRIAGWPEAQRRLNVRVVPTGQTLLSMLV